MVEGSDSQSCCAPDRGEESAVFAATPEQVAANSSELAGDSGCLAAENGNNAASFDLVRLDGGNFRMGTDDRRFPADGEGPVRDVSVDGFGVSARLVTNEDFDAFVSATGHVTDAERFGWSFVFKDFVSAEVERGVSQVVQGSEWWWRVDGSYWREPEGTGSGVEDRGDHPVTHVSWTDAMAYCDWVGGRLPTEAEWEFAARGGLDQARFAWGDELEPEGEHMCNIWQGEFPNVNTLGDGWHGTSPVGSFAANGYGIYDVAGNVWEWCSDWFSASFHRNARRVTRENPKGPRNGSAKVIRGGSYLCHDSYCNRYRVGARTANTPDSSTGNLGFRVVVG